MFTLLLRAFIPLGYMPDLGALAHGKIAIIVCTMNGPQTVKVDAGFDPLQKSAPQTHDTKASDGLFCAVGLIAGWASLPLALVVLIIIAASSVPVFYDAFSLTRRKAHGLVSAFPRGPPVISL